jgi:hypothetical protein
MKSRFFNTTILILSLIVMVYSRANYPAANLDKRTTTTKQDTLRTTSSTLTTKSTTDTKTTVSTQTTKTERSTESSTTSSTSGTRVQKKSAQSTGKRVP